MGSTMTAPLAGTCLDCSFPTPPECAPTPVSQWPHPGSEGSAQRSGQCPEFYLHRGHELPADHGVLPPAQVQRPRRWGSGKGPTVSRKGSDQARKQAGPRQRDRWWEATARGRGDRERGSKPLRQKMGTEKRLRILGLGAGPGIMGWRQDEWLGGRTGSQE